MSYWKKLKTTPLLLHPRLTVHEDDVILPSGHKTKYLYFAHQRGAACVIALNKEGKILLQKEYSYPPNTWLYHFPGGTIDKEESHDKTAIRELSEEAGLAGDLSYIGWFYINNRRSDMKFHVYMAENLVEHKGTLDPEEVIEQHWFSEEEIFSLIARGDVTNSSLLAAWSLYTAKKR
jgi:ADP-ribose pyrophosphatase